MGANVLRPLISVIIPVYNVAEFVNDCVVSVINQTYMDLEIILVDDGSTDMSGKICDDLAAKDGRIVVYHKENGGLSDARNYGLDRYHGEYVTFIDSDDLIPHDYIEYLYKLVISDEKAEVSIVGTMSFIKNIPNETHANSTEKNVMTAEQAINRMALQNGFGHEACGKLFKRDVWKECRFPKVLYEDYAIIFYIIAQITSCVYGAGTKYYYRKRPGSIMKTGFQPKQLVLLDIADKVTEWVIGQYPDTREGMTIRKIVTYCKVLKNAMDARIDVSDEERIIREIKRVAPAFLRYNQARIIDKIKVATLCISKRLFYYVYLLGDYANERRDQKI